MEAEVAAILTHRHAVRTVHSVMQGKAITDSTKGREIPRRTKGNYKSAAIPILKTLSSFMTYPAASSPCSRR